MDLRNLPVGTPEVINDGDRWLEPVENILTKYSIDGADPTVDESKGGYRRSWDRVLSDKRQDYHYEAVVRTIREDGFTRPLTLELRNEGSGNDYRFGDGHHRLAAAIELGFTTIPVEGYGMHRDCVSEDSGIWGTDDDPEYDPWPEEEEEEDSEEDDSEDEMQREYKAQALRNYSNWCPYHGSLWSRSQHNAHYGSVCAPDTWKPVALWKQQ